MPLKTLVKVGAITNLSDARYCAGMGVDFLGFRVVDTDPDYISPQAFQELRGWVAGPQMVAEIYGITSADTISRILEDYRPDYFELGPDELAVAGSLLTLPFILYIRDGEALPHNVIHPAYVVTQPRAAHFEKLIPAHDVLVEVKNQEELQIALSQTGVMGVCLNGGREIRPGLRNYDDLSEILETLEVD